MKTFFRTLIVLLITAALGWGAYLLIQSSPQTFAASGFDGERPTFSEDSTRPTRPEGFGEEGGEFEGREGLEAGGIVSVLGHLVLFAVVTFLFAIFTKLLPKKTKPIEADS